MVVGGNGVVLFSFVVCRLSVVERYFLYAVYAVPEIDFCAIQGKALYAGADVNVVYYRYSYNYTPLSLVFLYGVYSDRKIETAKYLIENGADIGHKTDSS